MKMKKALVEKGIVVIMFVMVLVVFSIAERETRKVLELQSAGNTAGITNKAGKLTASSSEKHMLNTRGRHQ